MPSRNIIKEYGANEYYHVYSRGVNKQPIFLDRDDYAYFLSLFKRYLSERPEQHKGHGLYPHFAKRLQLLCYCLMPNHVHMLLYQADASAMTECLRALMTSYSIYFNRKYGRIGPVFQSRYKASRITTTSYLEHISRYIHLNPAQWQTYDYSSLPYYLQKRRAEWVKPGPIMAIFDHNLEQYQRFLEDYQSQKQILDDIKWELAADPDSE